MLYHREWAVEAASESCVLMCQSLPCLLLYTARSDSFHYASSTVILIPSFTTESTGALEIYPVFTVFHHKIHTPSSFIMKLTLQLQLQFV